MATKKAVKKKTGKMAKKSVTTKKAVTTSMKNAREIEKFKEAYMDIRKDGEKRGFLTHFIVYILVNTLIVIINLTTTPNYHWFVWPLLGWGIGLAAHFVFEVIFLEKEVKESQIRAEAKLRLKK